MTARNYIKLAVYHTAHIPSPERFAPPRERRGGPSLPTAQHRPATSVTTWVWTIRGISPEEEAAAVKAAEETIASLRELFPEIPHRRYRVSAYRELDSCPLPVIGDIL